MLQSSGEKFAGSKLWTNEAPVIAKNKPSLSLMFIQHRILNYFENLYQLELMN